MSLANAVALGTCARSIVLIGDQNQLPMVTQGVHPGGAAASSLGHLVGDAATIAAGPRVVPRDLAPAPPGRQRVHLAGVLCGTAGDASGHGSAHAWTATIGSCPGPASAGSRSQHAGNGPRSREEADVVAAAVASLTRMTWQDVGRTIQAHRAGRRHRRRAVQRPGRRDPGGPRATRSGERGNVGTVDKFQGREGVVAIYSMASSSRDDAPRDMSFLYSRNRLDVAISRAQCVALLVASPTLLEAGCRTPEQMRMVDAMCRFVEVATAQATGASRALDDEPRA